MKRRLEMDRLFVQDNPELIYAAEVPVTVTLWCLPNLEVEDDEKNEFSHAYIGLSEATCTIDEGMPLPEDHPVDVALGAGEKLYAVTTDYTYMGYVVHTEE